MATIRSTSCCGVQEISGLSYNRRGPVESFKQAFTYNKELPSCGYFIFTEAGAGKYGQTFKKWIEENDLGDVVVTKDHKNPNHPKRKTGVRVFVWGLNRRKLQKWINDNVPDPAPRPYIYY